MKLGEVARVELGANDDETEFRGNGVNMIGPGIIKQSKANTLAVAQAIKVKIDEIQQDCQKTFLLCPATIPRFYSEIYRRLQHAGYCHGNGDTGYLLFLGNVRAIGASQYRAYLAGFRLYRDVRPGLFH